MLNIGRSFTFDAAHFISGHPTCGYMHGHTWYLDVKLIDCKTQEDGFVVDFKVLGGIVKDVLRHFDHKIINDVVDFAPVTAETLAVDIAARIRRVLRKVTNIQCSQIYIKLQEGEGGYAEHTTDYS